MILGKDEDNVKPTRYVLMRRILLLLEELFDQRVRCCGCSRRVLARTSRQPQWRSMPYVEGFTYQLNSPMGLDLKLAKWTPEVP